MDEIMAIRYMTAGESHGKCLTAILEGIPAGIPISKKEIDVELERRQHTFGRGERQQYIEKDAVEILSGVRFGETLGDPITLQVSNKDWVNWEKVMSLDKKDFDPKYALLRPRPGHADLPGIIKFNRSDTRDILERASARETAARTAVGTVCRKLLSLLGVRIFSWVDEIGGICAKIPGGAPDKISKQAASSPILCPDSKAAKAMMDLIAQAKKKGDTLGGAYQVVITGLPIGLGSFQQWDLKLDGLLAQAIMSIQAHKGVEFGRGFELADLKGSEAHDEIFFNKKAGFTRKTNNAGGIEGGMSNGEPITLRAVIKPLASLRRPLNSVNIKTKEMIKAEIVRSDVAPVASAAIIAEAVVAITLAQEFKRKFGGDSLREMKDNFGRYQKYVRDF
jgi:chorismate synthase